MLRPFTRSLLAPTALTTALVLGWASMPTAARAQALYTVERVERTDELVRVHAVAGLGPVEAVVRQNATTALERAAPELVAPRSIGTHRFSAPALDVHDVRFARGASANEVRIEVIADVTAEREHRAMRWNGLLPEWHWVRDGRHRLAAGRMTVRVGVAIADGSAVVLRILGERLTLADPLGMNLDLGGRVLHTHVQPIPEHPSIEGLRPEAAALTGLDGDRMRFVVRFRRR